MGIPDSEDFDIRFTNISDMSYLQKWLKLPGMLHWFPPSDESELETFVNVWMNFAKYSAALTAVFKDLPIGMAVLYLMPYRKVAHQCMFQIIVDPDYQRRGIGKALIKNLKHLAKTRFRLELIHVEILDQNPLIYLLESLEFTAFARQEKFVKEKDVYYPRILMECDL